MKYEKLVISMGFTISTILFTFNSTQAKIFTTNFTQNHASKGDVFFNYIEQNGTITDKFFFVEEVKFQEYDK